MTNWPDFNTVQTVENGHGVIAYRRAGSGQSLVLLHPLALSGAVWRPVVDRLAGSFDIIAPDARGHGHSSWDGTPFTMTDLATDVVAILDALTSGPVVLGGASMGGSTALVCAPGLTDGRLAALTVFDTTAWYGANAVDTWAGRAHKAASVPRVDQLPFQLDRWFTPETVESRPEICDPVVRVFLDTDSQAHAAASVAMGSLDAREGLTAVQAPTLVLAGANDYATPPAMGRLVAEGVHNGEFRELDGMRHLALLEKPDVADQITEFVAERVQV